jgi:hypothetical protein
MVKHYLLYFVVLTQFTSFIQKWLITLTESQALKKYYCSVSRPERNSYLFFMNFKLEIKGAKLERGEAFVSMFKLFNTE